MAMKPIKSKDNQIYIEFTASHIDDENETARGTFFASHKPIKKSTKKSKKK